MGRVWQSDRERARARGGAAAAGDTSLTQVLLCVAAPAALQVLKISHFFLCHVAAVVVAVVGAAAVAAAACLK